MNLRLRLLLTTAAVAVPLVAGLVWLDARSRHRAAEEALARLTRERFERPDAQARCEADPLAWGAPRPPGTEHGPGGGARPGPPPHGPSGPPPGLPRAAPPRFFAYDRALTARDPAAPRVDRDAAVALTEGAWAAIDRATFDDRVEVLVRSPWPDGPCAYVLVRGSTPRGFIGAILPATELWLAPLAATLIAVLVAVGPVVGRIRRLTADVRRSAAGGFVDAPTVGGADEVRQLGDAFVAASAEVRRQLAARDDRERALREYLANTTHDVMIPLTVLTQHLASLRAGVRTREPGELDEVVARAMDEAHYLAALIHNLSVAARVDVAEPRLEIRIGTRRRRPQRRVDPVQLGRRNHHRPQHMPALLQGPQARQRHGRVDEVREAGTTEAAESRQLRPPAGLGAGVPLQQQQSQPGRLLALVLGQLLEPRFDQPVQAARREGAADTAFARRQAGQQLEALIDARDGMHMEAAGLDGSHHLVVQHQVAHVRGRDDHALIAGEAPRLAELEEALDLVVDSADGLHIAMLVDRAGDGE